MYFIAISTSSSQTMSTHPQPKNEISCHLPYEENERILNLLRRNDPALKEVTLDMSRLSSESIRQLILQAFQAVATNTSLEVLNIEDDDTLFYYAYDHARSALSLNTSLKAIHIATCGIMMKVIFDIAMSSPNLESLTFRVNTHWSRPSTDDLTAVAQALQADTKLHSLTIQGFVLDSDCIAAFVPSFHGNHTIKTLNMRCRAVSRAAAVSFVKALPQDHSLEMINFDENGLDDDSAVTIVRTLGHTPLKALSLKGNQISQDGDTRIVRTLQDNEHNFTKLELFNDSQHSQWHNFVRLEIDRLTWENQLQEEKRTWVDLLLEQEAHSREMIFLALEQAKRVDNERFSDAPNMLNYLIKEIPDSIAQAFLNGQ
jgi:hypothetical protein